MIACVSDGFSNTGAEETMRYAFGFGIIDVNHKFKLVGVQLGHGRPLRYVFYKYLVLYLCLG